MNDQINSDLRQTEDISLKEILLKVNHWYKYMLSKWLTILIYSFLGAAIGVSYGLLSKSTYTASTTFVLENGDGSGSNLGQYAGLASMAGIDIGGGGGGMFQGDNILELYKSRAMIQKTLLSPVMENSKELIVDRYILVNELKDKWSKKAELLNLKFSPESYRADASNPKIVRLKDSVMGKIVEAINKDGLKASRPDKKLNKMQVDVKSKDEAFAKLFNDQLVKNVNEFYIQTKTKKSADNIAILNQKVDSVRSIMYGSINSAAAIGDATPNLNPTRLAQRIAPIQRRQFEATSSQAILSEMVKNLEISKMNLMKETPLIQVIDQPIFPLEKERFGGLKGLIFGGIGAGFLICLILTMKFILKNILNNN